MKVKAVVTLPKEIMLSVDALTDKKHKRSAVIEIALRDFFQNKAKEERYRRELEIINNNAEKLNEEALDVLEYQQVKW
jgi:metal-responsive CopG/Arc/MetJ family transcriptional regulator